MAGCTRRRSPAVWLNRWHSFLLRAGPARAGAGGSLALCVVGFFTRLQRTHADGGPWRVHGDFIRRWGRRRSTRPLFAADGADDPRRAGDGLDLPPHRRRRQPSSFPRSSSGGPGRKTQDVVAELRRKFQANITGGQALARPRGPSVAAAGAAAAAAAHRDGAAGVQLRGTPAAGPADDRHHARQPAVPAPRVDPSPTKPQLDVRITAPRRRTCACPSPASRRCSSPCSAAGG